MTGIAILDAGCRVVLDLHVFAESVRAKHLRIIQNHLDTSKITPKFILLE